MVYCIYIYPEDVDLLLIDTEGHDYKVLASATLKNIKPWIIGLEHCHLTDDELRLTFKLLKREGYRIKICRDDLMAINPSYHRTTSQDFEAADAH